MPKVLIFLTLALLCLLATAALAADFVLCEGEHYFKQAGTRGPDYKSAASGGQVLGLEWGTHQGNFARWRLHLDSAVSPGALLVRYARQLPDSAPFDLALDGPGLHLKRRLAFASTGGWGEQSSDFRLLRLDLPALAPGDYLLQLTAAAENCNTNIDCLLLGSAAALPRTDKEFQAFLARLELEKIQRLRRLDAPATFELPAFEQVPFASKRFLKQARSSRVLSCLASKPNPYLVKGWDTPGGTDPTGDYTWQLLAKETTIELPLEATFGALNPNSEVGCALGLAFPGRPLNFKLPLEWRLHLPDACCAETTFGPFTIRLWLLPVRSNVLAGVVEVENTSSALQSLQVAGALFRRFVPDWPAPGSRNGVRCTTGTLLDYGKSKHRRGVYLRLLEAAPSNTLAGDLLAVQAAPVPAETVAFRQGVRPGAPSTPVQVALQRWTLQVKPGERRTLRLAWALQRRALAPQPPRPRSLELYPRLSDAELFNRLASALAIGLSARLEDYLEPAFDYYRRFPEVDLGSRRADTTFYASLELPRAETFSPFEHLATPYYNFCRAYAHDPYDWWSYGMHAHESLSVCTQNLVEPSLSAYWLEGQFSLQSKDGSIPYGTSFQQKPADSVSTQTCPFLMYEAWRTYLASGDKAFLQRAYTAGSRWNHWWRTHRDRAGLGLHHWNGFGETVRDDADLPTWTFTGGAAHQEALDLNCYLFLQEKLLGLMASELDKPDDAARWADLAARRKQLMDEYMWDLHDHLYYGVDLVNQRLVKIKDLSTLLPLWAGLPSPARASYLLDEFRNPSTFHLRYGVPVLALSAPLFNPAWHWHGGNWLEMTCLVMEGLRNYGAFSDAADLAWRNFSMVQRELYLEGHFREWWNSWTGRGTGLYDYIWASMGAPLVVEGLFGLRLRREGLELRPALPPSLDSIALHRLHLRGKTLTLLVKRTGTRAITLNGSPLPLDAQGKSLLEWRRLPAKATFVCEVE